MTKPKVFEKPSGVKDYLPKAVSKLRQMERDVLARMQTWGYQQIITPTLEYYDTVGAMSTTSDKRLFKMLDKRGTTMVLRSDMTAPIARVAASLLKNQPLPLRLSYHSNVFRAMEDEAGRDSEFFQTGVELIGDDSPDADAEMIALAIESLQAAGVTKFKVAMGHVGFLHGLFRETLPELPEVQDQLKDHLLHRDHVGYRKALKELSLTDELSEELQGILRLRGGKEICDQALLLTADPTAQAAIHHLCEVWEVLKVYGVSQHVLIDLTMIGDFSYYTGMTFEGYASDLGFPVCNGGRYDTLLDQFGRPAPATGFSLKTNRILELLSRSASEEPYRVLIVYTKKNREQALRTAADFRTKEGFMVETRLVKGPLHLNNVGEDQYEASGVIYNDVIQMTS